MAVTVELVNQALFLSSIFLMAISLPKILIYTLWSIYRVFIFEHAHGWKITRMILAEKTIQESLKPDNRIARLAKETESYTRDLKRPIIELFSASLFLQISSSELTVESDAGNVISVLQAVMIFVIAFAVVNLLANFLRMRVIKGGGPLA